MADVMLKLKVTADGQGNLTAVAQGLEKVEKQAKDTQTSLDKFGKSVAQGLGIGAGMLSIEAAVGALKGLARGMQESADWAEKLGQAARKTGMSTTTLQQLETSAKNLGLSMESVTGAAAKMQRGVAENSDAFKKLGLSTEELKKLGVEGMFTRVAQSITNIADPTEQAAAAMDVFGRSGAEVIPLLDEIASGAYKVNEVLGTDSVKALEDLDQALDKAKTGWELFYKSMAAGIAKQVMSPFGITGTGGLPLIRSRLNTQGVFPTFDPAQYLDTTPLSLGPASPEQKAAVSAYNEKLSEQARTQKTIKELLERQLETAKKLWYGMSNPGINKVLASHLGPTKNIYGMSGDTNYDFGGNFLGDKIDPAADAIKKATAETIKWQGAMQGVALLAGAAGGRIGDTALVMANIAESFKGFGGMTKDQKFYAIAGAAGQVGGLVGGKAGAGIQGAAGGAMAGFSVGGPIGAVVGGVIGGVAGWVGGSKKEREEKRLALEQINDLIKQQYGSMSEAIRIADKYGVSLKTATDKKGAEALAEQLNEVNKRMKGTQTMLDGLVKMFSSLSYEKDGEMFDTFSDPAVADAMAQSFGSIFWATWKRMGIAAVDQLRPAWEQLHKMFSSEQLTAMGFGSIGKLFDAVADPRTRALLGFSQGGAQLMTGALDAGYMSEPLLRDQTTLARATLKELEGQGLDANAMADQLVALAKSYEATGQQLPDDLKKAMEDAGIKVLDTQLEVLKDIRDLLAGEPPQSKDPRNPKSSDPYDPQSGDFESAAVGYGPRKLDRDTMFLAHEGEHVLIIPRGRKVGFKSALRGYPEDDGGGDWGGGGGGYVPPTPTTTPTTSTGTSSNTTDEFTTSADSSGVRNTTTNKTQPNQIIVSPTINASAYHDAQTRQELSRFVVDELVSQIRNNPTLRRELRDVR